LNFMLIDRLEFESGVYSDHRDFWKRMLSEEPQRYGSHRDAGLHKPVTRSFEIDPGDVHTINKLVNDSSTGIFVCLVSSLGIVFRRFFGEKTILFNSPLFGNNTADAYGSIVPLSILIDDELTLRSYLSDTQQCVKKSYQYQDFPLSVLHDADPNRLLYMSNVLVEMDGLHSASYDRSAYDVIFSIHRSDAIKISVSFIETVFHKEIIDNIIKSFHVVLSQFKDTGVLLKDIELLSDDDLKSFMVSRTAITPFPGEETIHSIFEQQAAANPEALAIIFGEKRITYSELDRLSDVFAALLSKTTTRGDLVGILMDRSDKVITAMLAIMKCGCAYVPVDPEYPLERKNDIFNSSRVTFLITESQHVADPARPDVPFFNVDTQWHELGECHGKVNYAVKSHDLAYVIYTSGSTGKPKGVEVEHRGIVNMVLRQIDRFGITSSERIGQFASISFDSLVTEIFDCLLCGACSVILAGMESKDPTKLLDAIEKYKVTLIALPPAFLNSLDLNKLRTLRALKSIGDKANYKNALFCSQFLDFFNGYGPTECSVCTTTNKFEQKDIDHQSFSIGKPIDNVVVYIMDKCYKLLPDGLEGEICIGGVGVARGYRNNETLTNDKFVNDPYHPGGRMYKTGDMGRFRKDGNIEFIGRRDDQVKVRGYRIELGEIRLQLLKFDHITDAVVLVSGSDADKFIVAYVTVSSDTIESDIKTYLRTRLPEYMIPSYVLILDKIPLNTNAKVDKNALPDPRTVVIADDKVTAEPRDELERKLVTIWEEILGRHNIGINDNFFELGGHSLKAIQLITKLHEELNIELELGIIFEQPSIELLAGAINKAQPSTYQVIKPAAKQEHYKLSYAQHLVWIESQFEEGNLAYNLPGALEITGPLDVAAFEKTLQNLKDRHESLRTSFVIVEGEVRQKIHDAPAVRFPFEYAEDYNEKKASEDAMKPFDLSKGPLVRSKLFKLSDDQHLFVFTMHHIISDGWSSGVLIKEISTLYNAYRQGLAGSLKELRIQYKDFAEWQYEEAYRKTTEVQRSFWLDRFSELPVTLDLPTDFPRPAVKSREGKTKNFVFDAKEFLSLENVASLEGATLFMTMLAAMDILLGSLCNQDDIVIGTPTAGRSHSDVESIVGMFVNTLALRNHIDWTGTFRDHLRSVKKNTLQYFDNQGYQYEELIEELKIKRDLSRNPLFDVMLIVQNYEQSELTIPGLTLKPYRWNFDTSKLDLTLSVEQREDMLNVYVEYSTRLFREETIDRMMSYLRTIISEASRNPDQLLSTMDIVVDEERRWLMDLNATERDYNKEDTLVSVFERQVKKTPNNAAIHYESGQRSYRELDELSDRICGYLQNKIGVKQGDMVGLLMDRSVDMLVSMFGIMKCGAAYVPFDMRYPAQRINWMTADSKVKAVITKEFYQELMNDVFLKRKKVIVRGSDAAYVIYTSGSTGDAKGVIVEHCSVVNLMESMQRLYPAEQKDIFLLKTPVSFDLSILDLFWWPFSGSSIALLPVGGEQDPEKLISGIEQLKATILTFVPSILAVFLSSVAEKKDDIYERLKRLRMILTCGEVLKADHVRAFKQTLRKHNSSRLVNLYGPTETTVNVTHYECTFDEEVVSIGVPIDNAELYVLNKFQRLMTVNCTGELYIGGAGLGRGYLNNVQLTNDTFIPHPFKPGQRLYRTGDLAKVSLTGELFYVSRRDDQVKIRGFRIEPGEIERQLLLYPSITACVVVAAEREGSKFLAAYVTAKTTVNEAHVKQHLRLSLPEYMIPSVIIVMDAIPYTINGKVNRAALPDPTSRINGESAQPRNDLEKQLVVMWEALLGRTGIGISDDFFELGGHSLVAVKLMSAIYKQFGIAIEFKSIFDNRTIEKLAGVIGNLSPSEYDDIRPAPEQLYYELSYAQRQLWIQSQFDDGNAAYNVPGAFEMEGFLDIGAFEKAFQTLLERHESLRTSFVMIDGDIKQRIDDAKAVRFSLEYAESHDKEKALEDVTKPFDLSAGPLLRAKLVKLSERNYLFVFTMHHIISDGWSAEILVHEIIVLYEAYRNGLGNPLPPLRIQYKDYATWQRELVSSGKLANEKAFWMNELHGDLPVLSLPTDFPRSVTKTYRGSVVSDVFDPELAGFFRELSTRINASLFVTFLTSVAALLHRYSQQNDFIVGAPVMGRKHKDLDAQIGMYVNTVPIRIRVDPSDDLTTLMTKLRFTVLQSFKHQMYPVGQLIEELSARKSTDRYPLFDVVVLHHNADAGVLSKYNFNDLVVKDYQLNVPTSKFDLTFTLVEKEGVLTIEVNLNTGLFSVDTIRTMLGRYKRMLLAWKKHG
jgi:amino acid adenylation domain-containing protein